MTPPSVRRWPRVAAGPLVAALAVAGLTALPTPARAADALTPAQLQGTGASTPYAGQGVTLAPSAVTAVYGQASSDFRGFVVQTPGTGGPVRGLAAPSDAVFVFMGSTPFDVTVGDVVRVTGTAGEFGGLTQVAGSSVTRVPGTFPAVRPVTGLRWAATAAQRENLESMLWQGQDTFTVADTFPLLRFGELGLTSDGPLRQPTDVVPADDVAGVAAVEARNAARAVNVDDGTNRGFAVTATLPGRTLPWLRPGRPVTVGDRLTLTEPMVVDWRNGTWKLNPTRVVEAGSEPGVLRHRDARTPRVGGDVSVASFNVLNYFTSTGAEATADGCEGGNLDSTGSYNVTLDCDRRGAWDAADLARQQAKIVAAVNRLDASVTGLMEIENSARLGEPADEALATLVSALNTAAGYRKWAYVPSSSQLPPAEQQDVITNALIYQPREVRRTGRSDALGAAADDDGAFANARTPIAQAFTARRGGEPVLVVVNHFKSKSASGATGDNVDARDGQGAYNGDRTRQAAALAAWLPSVQRAANAPATALVGDFNSYTQEDPLLVLADAGFRNTAPRGSYTYTFDGLLGSLDHVLLNRAAQRRLTGSAVWNINAGQSAALEYSTYRTTALDYYRSDPLRSSDHDPVKVGLERR